MIVILEVLLPELTATSATATANRESCSASVATVKTGAPPSRSRGRYPRSTDLDELERQLVDVLRRQRLESCSAMTAPNGIATRALGRIDTLATNQNCPTNSRVWNGRFGSSLATSSPSSNIRPVWTNAGDPGNDQALPGVIPDHREPVGTARRR